jgi:hypothetical protein
MLGLAMQSSGLKSKFHPLSQKIVEGTPSVPKIIIAHLFLILRSFTFIRIDKMALLRGINQKQKSENTGFGTNANNGGRFINKNGTANIESEDAFVASHQLVSYDD